MTVSMAWQRTVVGEVAELVFASDSRLSGDGRRMDACPKLWPLPRGDSAIAFAGYSGNAYPLTLQLALAVNNYKPMRDRAVDLCEMKTHALRVFDSLADSIHDASEGQEKPRDVSFILGGYSWLHKRFFVWRIVWNDQTGRFMSCAPKRGIVESTGRVQFLPHGHSGRGSFGPIVFGGDRGLEAQLRLEELLTARRAAGATRLSLNWEPIEVLRDMLQAADPTGTIGGPPQVLKVYAHMNVQHFAVHWPQGDFALRPCLLGRPLLSYENTDAWLLDLSRRMTVHLRFSGEDVGRLTELSFARQSLLSFLSRRVVGPPRIDWAAVVDARNERWHRSRRNFSIV